MNLATLNSIYKELTFSNSIPPEAETRLKVKDVSWKQDFDQVSFNQISNFQLKSCCLKQRFVWQPVDRVG